MARQPRFTCNALSEMTSPPGFNNDLLNYCNTSLSNCSTASCTNTNTSSVFIGFQMLILPCEGDDGRTSGLQISIEFNETTVTDTYFGNTSVPMPGREGTEITVTLVHKDSGIVFAVSCLGVAMHPVCTRVQNTWLSAIDFL